ncbi:MAG TPA: Gfo/Idh/MocA family oxidoreductase [Candidatus Nanoarchaeia archaeon]|nr:Gfo/Idh/MocA family oxidoreductase [Candidatus Nanoarchaeia archaeon]
MKGNNLKIAVIGSGSIGKRHIRNFKDILGTRGEVIAFDVSKDALAIVEKEIGVRTTTDIDAALKEADAAVIATPNHLHVPLALKAVDNNCHVLIEKPLSHTLENVDILLNKAKAKNLIVTCGYMLRFYEPLKRVKQLIESGALGKIYGAQIHAGYYLPDWRPTIDYRKNYGAIKAQGGGIILDSIHELNYTKWLLGPVKKVSCFANKLSNLEIDTEDFGSIIAEHQSGTISHIQLDYLQRAYSRSCKIIGEHGTVIWNFTDHRVKHYDAATKTWSSTRMDNFDFNTTYRAEEEHFVKCIEGKEKPVVTGEEARDDVALALAALESAEKQQVINFKQ